MKLPPDYRPRRGDVLILHGTVRFDVDACDDDVHLNMDKKYKNSSVAVVILPLDQVVGIHCLTWNVGDKVRTLAMTLERANCGEVIGTYEDHVWVKFPNNSNPQTYHANQLVPVVEPEEIPAAEQDRALEQMRQAAEEEPVT